MLTREITQISFSLETKMSLKLSNESLTDSTFTFMLFTDVENAKEVRQAVMAGQFEASLLNPSMILDPFQVVVAANKAVHLREQNRMTTKNVHSEILFCLSPTKNISQSFKRFGMGDKASAVFVAVVDDTDGRVEADIKNRIRGTQVDVQTAQEFADINTIKEVFKITDEELTVCSLQEALVSKIASKEFVTL